MPLPGELRVRDRKALNMMRSMAMGLPNASVRRSLTRELPSKDHRARGLNWALRARWQSARVVRVRLREHDECRSN